MTRFLSFHYQSSGITFAEWVALYTLCLAPLTAHIASGVPQPSYLSETRPRWHDLVCLYNPTTIIWRYFAIADRRVRAKSWDPNDLAASNAIFWTDKGWDGSDHMTEASKPHCILKPDSTTASPLSWSSVKTIIITLQAAQALYSLVAGTFFLSIDTTFYPLALLGLLRLWACVWSIDTFSYALLSHDAAPAKQDVAANHDVVAKQDVTAKKEVAAEKEVAAKQDAAAKPDLTAKQDVESSSTNPPVIADAQPSGAERFHPTTSLHSRLFRAAFLLPVLGLLAIAIKYEIPVNGGDDNSIYTVSSFLVGLFYLIFMTATAFIFGYYFVTERTGTTIVPCVSQAWYKIYSTFLILFMVVMVVVFSLELRKTACGTYTSMDPTTEAYAGLCPPT